MSAPYVVLQPCAVGTAELKKGDAFDPAALSVPRRRVQQYLDLGRIGPAPAEDAPAPKAKAAPKRKTAPKTAPAPAPAPASTETAAE